MLLSILSIAGSVFVTKYVRVDKISIDLAFAEFMVWENSQLYSVGQLSSSLVPETSDIYNGDQDSLALKGSSH